MAKLTANQIDILSMTLSKMATQIAWIGHENFAATMQGLQKSLTKEFLAVSSAANPDPGFTSSKDVHESVVSMFKTAREAHLSATQLMRNAMNDKLTTYQNNVISEVLCRIAADSASRGETDAPEKLKTIRRALVAELQAVTAETSLSA